MKTPPQNRKSPGPIWVLSILFLTALPGAAQPTGATNYPIDLPTALRLAHTQNLDVQIAREGQREAVANQQSTFEQFFPWISAGAGYHRRNGMAQAVPGGTVSQARLQSYSPGGTLTAQLDLGDAYYKSLAARQLATAAAAALQSHAQDSTFAAAQGYLDLVHAAAQVGVLEESVRLAGEYQDQLHQAVAAGIAFKGDELRVQVQTRRRQLALRQAQEQQRVNSARLAQILHLDPLVELLPQELDLAPLKLIGTNSALDHLVQRALQCRPELKQGQALVSAARSAKNGALYGPAVPSLNAQAFLGGFGGGPDGGTDHFGAAQDYLFALAWRIGPGGLFDPGRVRAGAARFESARLGAQKERDQVIGEVVECQARMHSFGDQLATARENLVTAAQSLRLTQERKQFGVGIVLEDLQAQQDITQARSDYLALVAGFDKAQYALLRAVGGTVE
jgi:outer membrane protein TolC